jgi:hypothetical protein
MPQLSAEARDLNWLIGNFATKTPSVAHAMVVSADGLPVAVSDRLDRPMAGQLAAIASGLAGLTQGAASLLDCGLVKQTVVEMDRGPRRARWSRSARLTAVWYMRRKPCRDSTVLAPAATWLPPPGPVNTSASGSPPGGSCRRIASTTRGQAGSHGCRRRSWGGV